MTSKRPHRASARTPRPSGSWPSSACTKTAPSSSSSLLPSLPSNELSFDALSELIPHHPEHLEAFLFGARGPGRISKRPVQATLRTGEDGARLVGVVADGDDVVEAFAQVALEGLGLLARDVDPDLTHHLYRLWPDAGRFRTRTRDLEAFPGEIPQQPLGHLGAGRVVGAQK